MTDLIHRQAAIDALCNDLCGGNHDCKFYPNCDNLKPIQVLPSTDAVEVVRCKDCRLSEPGIGIVEYWCCYWDNKTLENGYCSYGERKDG